MASDRSRPPQTPVDPPPPPSGRWLTWAIVGGVIVLVLVGYLLVSSGS